MENSDVIKIILSYSWPGSGELVDYAERGFGFGGDDGAYGIIYPGDGEAVAEKNLAFYCRECDADGLEITEHDYLALLEQHLEKRGEKALAKRVAALRGPSPEPLRPFLGKSYGRAIPETDLRLRAQESLQGAIPPGLRAVSTEVRGHIIYWRCIFESESAKARHQDLLMDASHNVMGLFYHHADMVRDIRVVPVEREMEHLAFVLFERYEKKDCEA